MRMLIVGYHLSWNCWCNSDSRFSKNSSSKHILLRHKNWPTGILWINDLECAGLACNKVLVAVINLTDKTLTKAQVEVLCLNLTFVPASNFDHFLAVKDLHLVARNLVFKEMTSDPPNLKVFFRLRWNGRQFVLWNLSWMNNYLHKKVSSQSNFIQVFFSPITKHQHWIVCQACVLRIYENKL